MGTNTPARKPKAANGDGGIYERTRADGRVVYDVAWTYRDAKGRARRGWKRGFPTRAAAARHRRQVTQAVDVGSYTPPSALTLGEWLKQWVESARLGHQTRTGYRTKIRLHITPHLGHLHPERITEAFSRDVARSGLPRLCLHEARHTWATLALGAGVPAKVVQEHLGHANIAITLDTYTHVPAEMHADAVQRVTSMFV